MTLETKELIILVHGFGASRAVMWPFAQLLGAKGFRVRQWSYLSYFESIEKHASRFRGFINSELATENRFHIVAHSMGSIVVQTALKQSVAPNLGRIVLLAPPNRGSPVSRIASYCIGRLITPTCELSDNPSSFVNQLKRNEELDIGIIAARYDVLVPINNTHLPQERAHVVLRATHNSLLISTRASELTRRFLSNGSFAA